MTIEPPPLLETADLPSTDDSDADSFGDGC